MQFKKAEIYAKRGASKTSKNWICREHKSSNRPSRAIIILWPAWVVFSKIYNNIRSTCDTRTQEFMFSQKHWTRRLAKNKRQMSGNSKIFVGMQSLVTRLKYFHWRCSVLSWLGPYVPEHKEHSRQTYSGIFGRIEFRLFRSHCGQGGVASGANVRIT